MQNPNRRRFNAHTQKEACERESRSINKGTLSVSCTFVSCSSLEANAFTVRRSLHSCNKRNGESSRGFGGRSGQLEGFNSSHGCFLPQCRSFQCLRGTINVQLLWCLRPICCSKLVWLLDLASFCVYSLVCFPMKQERSPFPHNSWRIHVHTSHE